MYKKYTQYKQTIKQLSNLQLAGSPQQLVPITAVPTTYDTTRHIHTRAYTHTLQTHIKAT